PCQAMGSPQTGPMTPDPAVGYARLPNEQVGILTLQRPERRNCMTPELLDAFSAAVSDVLRDQDLRCLIITGQGDCFSAGADLKASLQRSTGTAYDAPHAKSYAM